MSARFRKRGRKVAGGTAEGRPGGRGGRIAAGSLAATIIGAVIKDLSRPNSLIRGLVSVGREKLLTRRKSAPAVDISRKVHVEVIPKQNSKDGGGEIKTSEKEV